MCGADTELSEYSRNSVRIARDRRGWRTIRASVAWQVEGQDAVPMERKGPGLELPHGVIHARTVEEDNNAKRRVEFTATR